MNLLSVKTIKDILLGHRLKPSKGLGQNFLIDRSVLNKIISAANLNPNDTVLEIGPGIGTLTKELAQVVKTSITVEKDHTMPEILKETLKEFPNIKIINGDILKINFQFLRSKYQLPNQYKLIANLPYYITSPTIRKFLESEYKPEVMVLMVQKEVAQRICAKPPKMSLLAVSVQFYADPQIISYVKKEAFWPKPKVDSAIIKIIPHNSLSKTDRHVVSTDFCDKFFKIVKAGFSQPRKQLANNLSEVFNKNREEINKWLLKNNINPKQRAETLTILDWQNLTNNLP